MRSNESLRGLLPGENLEVTIPAPLVSGADGVLLQQPVIVSDYILATQHIEYDSQLVPTSIAPLGASAHQDLASRRYHNLRGQAVTPTSLGVVISRGCKFVNQ